MPPPRVVAAQCRGYREGAYRATEGLLSFVLPGLRLTGIDNIALQAWATDWAAHPSPVGDGNFRWDLLSAKFQADPTHFHVAVWDQQTLCGLALAKSTSESICFHYLEGFHGHNRFAGRIALTCFTAGDFYGKVRGKRYIRLKNPAPGAIPHYKRLNFTYENRQQQDIFYVRNIA